jgi:hypothetical protein
VVQSDAPRPAWTLHTCNQRACQQKGRGKFEKRWSKAPYADALLLVHLLSDRARGVYGLTRGVLSMSRGWEPPRRAEGRWRGGRTTALLQQVLAMTPEQMERLTPVQRTQVEQLRAAAMSQGRM